jgi:RHS repeat-associated protein
LRVREGKIALERHRGHEYRSNLMKPLRIFLGLLTSLCAAAHVPLAAPVTLSANTSYYLVSQEVNGGDIWYDFNSTLGHTWAASIGNAAFNGGAPPYYSYGSVNNGYGPVNLKYDAGGSWVQTGETHYIYDGMQVVQERDGSNNPLVTYTRGLDISGTLDGAGGIGGLLARTRHGADGVTAYYHSDLGGNITAMANGSGLVANYLYDPYGNTISATGYLAEANKYRFSSKELHSASGLYHYGFRDYDPSLQRWLTTDPIGEMGGLNLYEPFFNSPTTFVDRDGRDNIYASAANIAALSIENAPVNGTFTATAIFKQVYTPSIPSFQNPGTPPNYQPASTRYEFTGSYKYSSEFQPADPIGPFFRHVAPEVAKQLAIFALTEGAGELVSGAKCFSAAETTVARNPNVYEALFESPISGTSRAAHRASANDFLANQLRNDSQLSGMFNQELGGNVLQHMESGSSGLLNPPGTAWHHPFDNSNVMQLLRTSEHTAPSLQPVLHPGGVGGFGNFYGP